MLQRNVSADTTQRGSGGANAVVVLRVRRNDCRNARWVHTEKSVRDRALVEHEGTK